MYSNWAEQKPLTPLPSSRRNAIGLKWEHVRDNFLIVSVIEGSFFISDAIPAEDQPVLEQANSPKWRKDPRQLLHQDTTYGLQPSENYYQEAAQDAKLVVRLNGCMPAKPSWGR
jgi:hypothetical protein